MKKQELINFIEKLEPIFKTLFECVEELKKTTRELEIPIEPWVKASCVRIKKQMKAADDRRTAIILSEILLDSKRSKKKKIRL